MEEKVSTGLHHNGSELFIHTEQLGPHQARHYAGGDTILEGDIRAGKVSIYVVRRADGSRFLPESGRGFRTRAGAQRATEQALSE